MKEEDMKKVKWNKKGLFLLFIGFILINVWMNTVSAKALDDRFYDGDYIYGTYYKKIKNGISYYETARFLVRSDGQFAYCIQPFVAFVNGKLQKAYQHDYAMVTHMTEEQWKRVSLLAYYGYQYQNHTEEKWYAITQLMIWQTVDPTNEMFFTSTLNGNRISIYESEMAELEQLVRNHNIVPNFDEQSYILSIGQTIILNDRNAVLSQFSVMNDSNIAVNKWENQLSITANHVGHSNIKLSKNDTKYTMPPIVYVDSTGQDLLVAGSYEPIESTLDVNVVGGKIRITKVDSENNMPLAQGEATLIGAVYHVFDTNHNVVSILTVGNDYTATTDYLPYGEYTIQEVKSSNGYQLNSTIYSVTIDSKSTVDIIVKEEVIKGRIQITKVDSNTNICESRGEATLVGAQYGIYDGQSHLIETLTIGDDCTALSKPLPYGNYLVKELSSSKGYYLNPEVYNQFVSGNTIYPIIAKEDVIENKFQINKFYGYGNTGIVYVEKGAIFNILNDQKEVVDTIETDENGYAEINLPYGTYTIKQVAGITGYQYINPVTIYVNEQTSPIQSYHLKDGSIEAKIKLMKIDSETKQSILVKNVKFKIKNQKTNLYICQTTNQSICEFETNDEGIMITPLPLSSGIYQIEEVEAPYGYLLSNQPLEFSIDENANITQDDTYGPIIEILFENQPVKGKIEIYKMGEKVVTQEKHYFYEPYALGGVQFNLYDENENFITTLTTNENGYAVADQLPLGTYRLKEQKSVGQHLIDQKEYVITLEYQGDDTPIVSKKITLYNYLSKGDLSFTKIDTTTKQGIPDTVIEIYTEEGICIYHGTTDLNGKIIIPNLFTGNFYAIEVKSAAGYALSNDPLYFDIVENDEIVSITMENEKIGKVLGVEKEQIVDIPDTAMEQYNEIISVLLVIFGIGFFIYGKIQ